MTVTVRATGPLTTVQDLGRPGLAGLGVSPSGAADRAAYQLANRLVGNPPGAAALEVTLGGLAVQAEASCVVAVTGAPLPVTVDGRPTGVNASFTLAAGRTLALGVPWAGLRTYLAVRGGIDVPAVLGSRSTDLLGGLGPRPLRAGDALAIGGGHLPGMPDTDLAPVAAPTSGDAVLWCLPGPRRDWFADPGVLTRSRWLVSADSNRIAARLSGPQLHRSVPGELPSEGLVRGAVQVPSSGQPLIFLADHPTTGGYPVIAVLRADSADTAAQLRPGQGVRFRWSG